VRGEQGTVGKKDGYPEKANGNPVRGGKRKLRKDQQQKRRRI